MTIAANNLAPTPPPRRKWSRKDLGFLIDCRLFMPGERLELVEGEIVEKMPQNRPRATGISLCEEALRAVLPKGFYLCIQLPFAVSDLSQPDPDVMVVPGSAHDYEDDHPQTATLVVEVADTSLSYDRATKAGLYASACVPEYWTLNLNDRLLEVHRQPAALSAEPGGHRYLSIERYSE